MPQSHNTSLECKVDIHALSPRLSDHWMFPQDKDILLQTEYYEDNSSLQDIPLELLCLLRNNNLLDMTCKYHFPVDLDMFLLDKRLDSLIPLDNMNLLDIPTCHHQMDSLFHLDNNILPNIYELPTLYHSKDNNILSHRIHIWDIDDKPNALKYLYLEDIEWGPDEPSGQ